ncbi:MAG: response regulator [Lachnospiraceae bacterium]|nr:response regulator [Lachnospiraceae bacterium]
MLPFRTNLTIFIIEFLCSVLLQTFYAISEYGVEKAFLAALGLIPVLLVFLISYHIENEKVVVYCLLFAGLASLYYMSYVTGTQGMLMFTFLATGTTIALFLILKALIVYFAVTSVILIAMFTFQQDLVLTSFDSSQYISYITLYAFAGVALIFISYSVEKYKADMDEKNEIAREALEAKSNFLANMSHEIRTPMNAIYGMAELLGERNFNPEEKEYVATIKRSSENLLSIINEILDFSKVDSGKMEILEEPFSFNEMLQDVVTIIEFRMRGKNIVLRLEVDPKVPTMLLGDETRVRQILINVLNNAVKFTNQGSITLGIMWKDESMIYNTEQGRLIIYVQDTGIGISEENIKKLFTEFGQIDTKKNRNVEGTGLGLAICKRLVDAMNGEIKVSSKLGVGSTFTIVLPQKVFDATESHFEFRHLDNTSTNAYTPEFTSPTAKVLIVDDNKVNLQVAVELLKIFGIEAQTVESGQDAIDRIAKKTQRFDLIFMDHMMPFMDGVEATRQIRLLGNTGAKVPIVALTANAIKGVDRLFAEAGMNDYIPKPIRLEQLGAVLKKWLPKDKIYPYGTPAEEIIRRERASGWDLLSLEERLERLEGIDIDTGIKNCGGKKDTYIELLRTYSGSNLAYLLDEFYEKEDMENYAITAHSIKGASLSVGATDIADMAYSLERAAKRGDINYVWDHHEEMTESYKKILTMLKAMFRIPSTTF